LGAATELSWFGDGNRPKAEVARIEKLPFNAQFTGLRGFSRSSGGMMG